jgi:predicted DNA-binding transcriptional regulator AlpA
LPEVRHRLGLSTSSVYRLVKDGLLEPPLNLGARTPNQP